MSIWKRLLSLIDRRPNARPRTFQISDSVHTTLVTLAQQRGRPEDDFATELLAAGLKQLYSTDELYLKWEPLTAREREVAALICLGYTNRQAAAKMNVVPQTVKFHTHHIYEKYGIKSRSQLQQLLSDWDWSEWKDYWRDKG